MNNPHLKSLGQDPEGYDKEVRAKLKGSGSIKRKQAQQLRRIKEMPLEKIKDKGLELIHNSDASAIQIMQIINEMLSRDLPDKIKLDLLGKMVQAHSAIHGQKTKNLNLNITTVASETIRRLEMSDEI